MEVLQTIVIFFAVLGFLVFVHELGHFLTAKWFGVTVLEFGFGYPPKLAGVRRVGGKLQFHVVGIGRWNISLPRRLHAKPPKVAAPAPVAVGPGGAETVEPRPAQAAEPTEYTINWLPLGGFVRMVGEEDPTAPGSLASKSIPKRIIVLCAGVFMNALFAFLLFGIALMVPRDVTVGQVVVQSVAPGSPAEAAGLQPGDTILKVNDRRIQNVGELSYNIMLNQGSPVQMVVQRDRYTQATLTVNTRLNPPQGQGATGISIGMQSAYTESQALPFWEAFPQGVQKSFDMLSLTKNGILSAIARQVAPPVAGPVGIAQTTGEVAKLGPSYLLELAALLSINLAFVNILPIPMLDGGRLVFVLLEAVRRGKRISPQKEQLVHLAGLAFLLTLMIALTFNDISNIISGGSAIR